MHPYVDEKSPIPRKTLTMLTIPIGTSYASDDGIITVIIILLIIFIIIKYHLTIGVLS